MSLSPDQIRAARALKNWSQTELAENTGLAVPTIANIESGKQKPSTKTIDKIVQCFETVGVNFIADRGVRKSRTDVQHYFDKKGFIDFLDDLYKVASMEGGEIFLFNASPKNWLQWIGDWFYDVHNPRMIEIKDKLDYRLICKEGVTDFISSGFGTYRWIPKALFNEDAAFYVYGGNVAFINFQNNSVSITAIHQPQVALAMRIMFQSAWDNLTIDTPEH